MSPSSIVLKSPGYAGLGDLLLALDRALLVARVTGRCLVVDWRDTPYSRGELNLAEQLFELKGIEHLTPTVLANASGAVEPVAWQGHLDLPLRQLYGSLRSDNWNRAWASAHLDAGQAALDSEVPWVVLWDHNDPVLQAEVLRRLGIQAPPPLQEHLQLLPALQDAISRFQEQHFRKPMIGVHLRASGEAVRAGKSADLSQVCERLDQLLEAHPNSGLFLASDNADAIDAMRARYADVLTRPKWLPIADSPLHLADDSEASGLAIACDALIELVLLASCDQLIHPALSSFSLAAARWGGLPSDRLHPIAPPQARFRQQWAWPEAGWFTRDHMLAIPAREVADPGRLDPAPVVSVLMMTRNHQAYLEQAVASVLSQELAEPFELLIGEDASSDHTLDIALRLQQQHPERIRVLHADGNVGITANFLRLVAQARAPFLALLEGDDYWTDSSKLRLQLQLLRHHPEAACAAAATANRTACLPERPTYNLIDILRRYPVHTSTLLIRAEHLLTYPRFPDIIGWESMMLGYLLARGSCVVLDRTVSFYRRHDGGLWHNADRLDRLRRSRQCIDSLDAYFFHRFRPELSSRELWIYAMDQALPQRGRLAHWCRSWSLLLGQAPRLLIRTPLGFVLLVARLLLQPFGYASMLLRRRLALGTRLRALVFGGLAS